ncbi:MAG: hypothetical protein AB7S72_18790 [Draconibacterium sp.]
MKVCPFLIFLVLFCFNRNSFAQHSDERQLWIITARISHQSTYRRDTVSSFMAGSKKWEKEIHQSSKETSSGTITAVVENQAENPATGFLYHSDAGDPVSLTVTGNGSNSQSSNGKETIDGILISADIRTDNVSGTAYPGASLYFEFTEESKSFDVGISIKAIGSYSGQMYSGGQGYGEWKDYGGDYDDYGLNCSGSGDALTDKNCKITKTGKGFQGSWKESESKKRHTASGPEYRTSETSIEITVEPYKESEKPEVTLVGCSELGVGGQAMIVATAKPVGGTFRFWAEPSSMMTVENDGSSANLTGVSPDRGTLFVEYTTPDGKTAQTSQTATCVKIESYNSSQPIPQIALYDIDGKKLPGIKTIPVNAQPANATELVKFIPADPGVISALGVGSEVTLQGIRIGTTTLQAKTNCGEDTGPAVEVEVVNCDDETIATLERMKKAAMENLVDATKKLQKEAGSPEFEKARDELVSSTVELLAKAGLTIIANGKTSGAVKVAAEIADKGSALSEIIASSNPEELKNNIGKTASGESFEKIVKNQFGEVVEGLWGKSLSAAIGVAEVQQAAQKFGDNIGEILKHEDIMEGLADNYEQAMRNFDRITKRLNVCNEGTEQPQAKEQPKSDPTPKPSDPKQPKEPTPKPKPTPGEQPKPTEPPTEEPTVDDEVIGDPEPPIVPPKQVGLPYEPADCGCDKSKDLTIKSADFSIMGVGMKNLGGCVEDFKTTSLTDYQNALEELSSLTDSLSTKLKVDATAFLVKAKESKPRLDEIITRVKSYDKAGAEFLKTMEKCPESLTTGMEILQSVEKITIDSIKTNY